MVRRHYLTMLELLIILIVLFVLLVILAPVGLFHGGGHREKARRANCSGNLKQMGVAMLMYSDDNDGYFPLTPEGNSLDALNTADILKDSKVYGCPSNPVRAETAADSNYWYVGSGLKDDDAEMSTERIIFDMYGNHGGKNNEWMNVLFVDGHTEGSKPGAHPFTNSNAVLKPTGGKK